MPMSRTELKGTCLSSVLEVGIVGAKVLFLHFVPGTLTKSDTQNFSAPPFYRFDMNKPWQPDTKPGKRGNP